MVTKRHAGTGLAHRASSSCNETSAGETRLYFSRCEENAGDFELLIQAANVSWLQFCVKVSELLLMFQDATAPATGSPAATPATGAASPAVPAVGDAGAGAATDAPSPIAQFAPIIIIGFFFYFILLRPQQKEQKRRQEFLNNLKKNSKVVTTGGLIGTVVDVSSDGRFVTLKVDDSTRMKFLRSAIQQELDEKVEASTGTST